MLPVETALDLPRERVLDGAITNGVTDCLLLGYDNNGDFYMAAQTGDEGCSRVARSARAFPSVLGLGVSPWSATLHVAHAIRAAFAERHDVILDPAGTSPVAFETAPGVTGPGGRAPRLRSTAARRRGSTFTWLEPSCAIDA